MELLWNEFGVMRLIHRSTEQTEIEGIIPLPASNNTASGYDEAIEILDYAAEVLVANCRSYTGKINVEGEIMLRVVAADESEKAFSFTSSSAFSYTAEAENADVGMSVDVIPSIKSLNLRHLSGAQLMLNTLIDLEITVTSATPMKVLSGVSGVSDMEMKLVKVPTGRKVELANETIRFSEEIASDGADEVLQYNAQISVRDTTIENRNSGAASGNASLSGMITLNALCRNSDGELMQIVRNIPFRESIEMNGSADEVYTSAELENINIRALGTEFALIAFDADINFRVFGMRRGELSVPIDAFSPSLNFNCLFQNISALNSEGGACTQHSIRENLTVPEGLPDIFTALNASVRPIATSIDFSNDEMQIDGLLVTRFIYRSSANKLYSFTEDVPFAISIPTPMASNAEPFVKLRLNAQPSVTGGGGRTAQIAYSIDVSSEFFSIHEINAVVGIVEANGDDVSGGNVVPKGIVIYNACDGDTVFDIARRFRIPSARVPELNGNLSEVFKDGDKILLLV